MASKASRKRRALERQKSKSKDIPKRDSDPSDRDGDQQGSAQAPAQPPLPDPASPLNLRQTPNNNSHADNRQGDTGEYRKRQIQHVRDRPFFAWTELLLAAGIALAAGAQIVVGVLQWNAMNAQNDVLKSTVAQTDEIIKQMRSEQRALLVIEMPEVEPLTEGKPIRLTLRVSNTGNTPATLRRRFIQFRSVQQKELDDALESAPQFPAEYESGRTVSVPPESQFAVSPHDIPIMTPEQMKAIEEAERWLMLYVRLEYETIGDEKIHTTEGNYIYGPDSGKFSAWGSLNRMD